MVPDNYSIVMSLQSRRLCSTNSSTLFNKLVDFVKPFNRNCFLKPLLLSTHDLIETRNIHEFAHMIGKLVVLFFLEGFD